MSPVALMGIGLVLVAVMMAATWVVAVRMDNFGIVDVAWTAAVGLLAVAYPLWTDTPPTRAAVVAVTGGVWSVRLATYLYRRVMSLHPAEDARYQDLRRQWRGHVTWRMFWFFQAQALAAAFFSLPFALTLGNQAPRLTAVEWAGVVVWSIGLLGESLADWQLASFKAHPANQGAICRQGLWRVSRHPNYFFEWIIWCGFALIAAAAPWGILAAFAPAAMLWLLLRVTGIPALEAAAVARRGQAYRDYQRTTSAFVPWFPS